MIRWIKLMARDLRSDTVSLGIILGLIIFWHLFVAARVGGQVELSLALALLPMFILPFWLVWAGFQSFRSEWRDGTAYLLLSLPVKRWEIWGAKILSGILEFILILGVLSTSFIIFFWGRLSQVDGTQYWMEQNLLFSATLRLFWLGLMGAVTLLVVSQFSFLASRIVYRLRGLTAIWVFLLTFWVVERLSGLIARGLWWLPSYRLPTILIVNNLPYSGWLTLDITRLVGSLLVALLLFGLGSWLLERVVEI